MNHLKKYIWLLLGVILALCPASVFAMSTISSVIRLDISEGAIKGENADYTFVLPTSWKNGSVVVNREKPSSNGLFLDKLIFLYIPRDKITKPVTFATLYVCDNKPDLTIGGSRRILETDRYTFMFDSTAKNNFIDGGIDYPLFNHYISSASNDPMMASQIEAAQRKTVANTVTVNGRLLKSQSVQSYAGAGTSTAYIPVREACSALGYYVDWSDHDFTVTIWNADEKYILSTSRSSLPQNYSTLIIGDKAYVSSVFFMRELNANIEVDSLNNVVINSINS